MVLVKDEEMLVTGGADSELRVWGLKWMKEDKENSAKKKLIVPCNSDTDTKDDAKDDLEDDGSNLTVTRLGSVLRKGEGRVGGLVVDRTGRCWPATAATTCSRCSSSAARRRWTGGSPGGSRRRRSGPARR